MPNRKGTLKLKLRTVWSSLATGLTVFVVQYFLPVGPAVMGIDETIERRRGVQIKAKDIQLEKYNLDKAQLGVFVEYLLQ